VIDDDQNLNGSLRRKFKKVGLPSEGAFDGKQGLDLMKRERFDGILLDLKMPVLDGFAVLKGKNDTLNPDTPVYVLTAMNEKQCERARALGAREAFDKIHISPLEVAEEVKKRLFAG